MRTDVVVIGAGQAGLSSAYFLRRFGFEPESGYVVLDNAPKSGGAWQWRWPSLVLGKVHGIHDLPGMPFGKPDSSRPASEVVSEYFAKYEREFALPVHRPVAVRSVRYSPADDFIVDTSAGEWSARGIINATGTWERPFWPYYPGQASFRGRQLHTADYRGPQEFTGQHVVVVGAGASATQLLAEISQVAKTTWVTRRPVEFLDEPFTEDVGRAVIARVEARVRAGLPPESVVQATGLHATPDVRAAIDRGVMTRLPIFERITPTGVAWADGHQIDADVILWCTGFRAAIDHLSPLRLRGPGGGIRIEGTHAVAEPRLHLVGYGPSASTIGANRAGRAAVRELRNLLDSARAA